VPTYGSSRRQREIRARGPVLEWAHLGSNQGFDLLLFAFEGKKNLLAPLGD
jgi:hypothetical protein